MRVRETVIRPFGNSAGVTLPKDTLEKYDLDKGDRIFIEETERGIMLTPYDPGFAEVVEIAHSVAKRYRNALRELAK